MIQWWNGLTLLEQIFTCIAVPSTLILIIQTIMAIIGLGDNDLDADGAGADVSTDTDTDADTGIDADSDSNAEIPDDGLRILTVRGLVAFLVMFGWVGLCVSRGGSGTLLSLGAGLIAGVVAMVLIALLFKGAMKLQHDGTLDIRNALGVGGTVYITVPAHRDGKGKVNVLVQGALTELEAVSDSDEPLRYGTEVVVIGISGSDTLVVKSK